MTLRGRLTLTMGGLALFACAAVAYFTFRAASDIIESDARRLVGTVAESERSMLEHTLTAQFDRLHSTADNMAKCSSEECVRASAERLLVRESPKAIRVEKRGEPPVELGAWQGLDPLAPPVPEVIARPFRDREGTQHYVMTRTVDTTTVSVVWEAVQLDPLFSRIPALGESGETFLADPEGYFVTTPRYTTGAGRTQPIRVPPMQRCLAGEDGAVEDVDYRGVRIIHGYRHVPQIGGGCVMAHVDLYEAEAPVRKLEREMLAATLASALVAIALAAYSANRLTRAIASLARYARRLRAGDFTAPAPRLHGTKEQVALAATLVRMAAGLREVEEVRERLIGILAHDLQSPLSSITLSTGLIQKTEPSPSTLKLARTISTNAKRMSRMISDLLDFTRSRRPEGLPVQKTDVDLGLFTTNAVETLRSGQPNRTIDVRCEGEVHARCDSDRVMQVVCNLVENAIRYGDDPITVHVRGNESDVEIAVHNWGAPIAADDLDRLFEAFRRGHEAAQQARGGIGLGLYIVDQILRAHGGRVEVTSSAAAGTTFVTHWPRT